MFYRFDWLVFAVNGCFSCFVLLSCCLWLWLGLVDSACWFRCGWFICSLVGFGFWIDLWFVLCLICWFVLYFRFVWFVFGCLLPVICLVGLICRWFVGWFGYFIVLVWVVGWLGIDLCFVGLFTADLLVLRVGFDVYVCLIWFSWFWFGCWFVVSGLFILMIGVCGCNLLLIALINAWWDSSFYCVYYLY